MMRALPLLMAAAALTGASARAQQPVATTKFEVAGIPVIYKPVRANDVVAVRLYIRGGSGNLTPANAGIENLMLRVARRGTQKYSRDAFAALATETGTEIGSDAGFDFSVMSLQGVRQHWNEAWDLFTQAALSPTFPAAEIEIVRAQSLDNLRRAQDDPDTYLRFLADSTVYASHPYAVRPAGTLTSVAGISRAALVDWHRQRLTKENLLLVVVGNVSREDLASKIAASFGKLPAKGGSARAIVALKPITPDVLVVKRDLPTNYITGYYSAPPPSDRDFAALRVATDILSDRLFEEVRTKRNLTYAVAAGLDTRAANIGRLYVTAVDPDTTLKVIFSEVRRLQNEPLSKEVLAENVNTFITEYWMGQQTNMGQASELGLFEVSGGGWQNEGRFVENVKRVTPADVQRVAKRYMQHARFAVIGDPTKINRTLFTSF